MVDYTQEERALKEIEYDWCFINILRDYLVDLDLAEVRLREVRGLLVKKYAGVKTDSTKTYDQLLADEDELQKRITGKYNNVKRTIYALNEMDSPASRFLLDYLLTPGLTVHKLSKMYNIHRQEAKRLLHKYNKILTDGNITELKKMVDDFEATHT